MQNFDIDVVIKRINEVDVAVTDGDACTLKLLQSPVNLEPMSDMSRGGSYSTLCMNSVSKLPKAYPE